MFANTQMGGVDPGFPDVCLTPAPPSPTPVPVPYPNTAAGPMGVKAVYNVLFMAAPAHNLGTSIPQTNGDNAGLATGVASKYCAARMSAAGRAHTLEATSAESPLSTDSGSASTGIGSSFGPLMNSRTTSLTGRSDTALRARPYASACAR